MGTVLPLHTNHLNKETVSRFCNPGLFVQFSIKTHAELHKEPSAWLAEFVRREQYLSSSSCKGQTCVL